MSVRLAVPHRVSCRLSSSNRQLAQPQCLTHHCCGREMCTSKPPFSTQPAGAWLKKKDLRHERRRLWHRNKFAPKMCRSWRRSSPGRGGGRLFPIVCWRWYSMSESFQGVKNGFILTSKAQTKVFCYNTRQETRVSSTTILFRRLSCLVLRLPLGFPPPTHSTLFVR